MVPLVGILPIWSLVLPCPTTDLAVFSPDFIKKSFLSSVHLRMSTSWQAAYKHQIEGFVNTTSWFSQLSGSGEHCQGKQGQPCEQTAVIGSISSAMLHQKIFNDVVTAVSSFQLRTFTCAAILSIKNVLNTVVCSFQLLPCQGE